MLYESANLMSRLMLVGILYFIEQSRWVRASIKYPNRVAATAILRKFYYMRLDINIILYLFIILPR